MKNKIIFVLFFLISLFPLFSQNKIPQRVIFFLQDATDDKNIDIKRYIENEIKKILEVLDSELIIRYTKEEEYKQYLNLLTPLTIDNMKKFYFNTNVRGIVSFSTKEENNKFLVQIECYNLNTGDVIKKDVTIEREKIIENINEFDNFIRELIIKNFPQIERKSIKEERFALLKLVREMPEFFLNVKGDIGYSSKYIQYRVFSSNSSSEDRQHNEYHNGFNIGFGVEGKIKLFYIGAGVNFLPYIVTNSDSFWFDITAYLETGFFLIQEILLVKSGSIAGVISTYDYLTENRIKIIPTIIGYIEIGAYPTKYIYPFFNISY